jgi:predicted AAA+ superfamily ATPase
MITRSDAIIHLKDLLISFPVVAILGARQVGKSTLSRTLQGFHTFDLENPRDLNRLENPQLALENLDGLVVIDEIQRKPELFPLLRYLVDLQPARRFLILGSASRDLIRQSSESLAGRIAYSGLGGFTLTETRKVDPDWHRLWLRGGFPRSWLAESDEKSAQWRTQFIQTYLERDIPQLGIRIPAATLNRFWTMLAHYHGQLLNCQELARSFGISDATVRHYLEILEGTFMIRLLRPYHANVGKRLVKAPKLYLCDSGLFHTLMDIPGRDSLESNPKLGASFEGFILEQVIRQLRLDPAGFWFYRTHAGTEIDLVWQKDGKRYGLEVKYSDAPRLTPSMRNGTEDLGLERLFVICPGGERYSLSDNIEVVPVNELYRI